MQALAECSRSTRLEPAPTTPAANAVRPLLAWTTLVVIGYGLVELVNSEARRLGVNAPPLTGSYEARANVRLLAAVIVAGGAITLGPLVATRLRWVHLLLVSVGASAAWALALAFVDGADAIVAPVSLPSEYLGDVPLVDSPGAFLSSFTDRFDTFRVHVRGHPPGLLLGLWSLDGVGLGGPGMTAALFIVGGALAVPAVLVAAREVAGETWARRAAPFVVLAPAAVWVATSADALFTGVGAWAVALVVLATDRDRAQNAGLAIAGGVLFGVTAFLSYGLVLLAVIPMVVAWNRRQLRPLAVAALGAGAVGLAFLAAGFFWVDGLLATRAEYFAGVGGRRPYAVFLISNLACLAVALGPAIAVALGRLRDRCAWLLVGGALLAVVLADVSGMSKGEVERIWLPFTPWILLAGAALAVGRHGRPYRARQWLTLQAGTALVVQSVVRTPW